MADSLFDIIEEQETAETRAALPPLAEAGPLFMDLIRRFHVAAMSGDEDAAEKIHEEARTLALHLNGGVGFMAFDHSSGPVLERMTKAPVGEIPIWGQQGEFEITVQGCRIRIEFDGILGMCVPGFSIHAVDWTKPFPSETGYRSCLGGKIGQLDPLAYVTGYIESYIDSHKTKKLPTGLHAIKDHDDQGNYIPPQREAVRDEKEAEEQIGDVPEDEDYPEDEQEESELNDDDDNGEG